MFSRSVTGKKSTSYKIDELRKKAISEVKVPKKKIAVRAHYCLF